jgi:hypothetical protein
MRDLWRNHRELLLLLRAERTLSYGGLLRGTPDDDELEFLHELVGRASTYPGPIIEIGTLFGFTTAKLAAWKGRGQRVVSVDNYSWNPVGLRPDDHRRVTKSVLFALQYAGEVEIVDLDKEEFYRTYAGPAPALVFLDAVHTYEETRRDIVWARAVGSHIICGHDHSDEFPGVVRAVAEAAGAARFRQTLWSLS